MIDTRDGSRGPAPYAVRRRDLPHLRFAPAVRLVSGPMDVFDMGARLNVRTREGDWFLGDPAQRGLRVIHPRVLKMLRRERRARRRAAAYRRRRRPEGIDD